MEGEILLQPLEEHASSNYLFPILLLSQPVWDHSWVQDSAPRALDSSSVSVRLSFLLHRIERVVLVSQGCFGNWVIRGSLRAAAGVQQAGIKVPLQHHLSSQGPRERYKAIREGCGPQWRIFQSRYNHGCPHLPWGIPVLTPVPIPVRAELSPLHTHNNI